MANIPVERTGGTPWWLWLLGLLLLGGLIWLGAELIDDEPDADELAGMEDNVGLVDDVEIGDDDADDLGETGYAGGGVADEGAIGGEITSLTTLASGTANLGREVDLDDMRVLSLTGDSSFFAAPGPDDDQGVLVVLTDMGEWRVGPGDGSDGLYDVNTGNSIDLEGTVRAFDASTPDYAEMPAADRDRLLRQGIYVSAGSLDLEKN